MSKANPTTYLELISKDEKAVKVEGLKIKAQESSIEVQREIMNLNASLAKANRGITAAARAIPYDVKLEYRLVATVVDLEDKLKFAKSILETRFSDISI